jgi:hypothetical protein
LLAVERGNIDLVIFSLLVFGFFLIERLRGEVKTFSSSVLIVLLTILKIYPLASVVVLARNRRGVLTALVTAGFSVVALILTSGHHLSQIVANTPQSLATSYGALPFFIRIGEHTLPILAAKIQEHPNIASIGAMILGTLSVFAGVVYSERLYRFLPRLDFGRATGCIAVSCMAIFCFTFLRGSNFNYRLIFLLGVMAYLVEDMNNDRSLRSLPATVILLIFFWTPSYHHALIPEGLDGLIFVVACAWSSTGLLDGFKTRDEVKSIDGSVPNGAIVNGMKSNVIQAP